MDGNFSAEQIKMRKPGNDVPLSPGNAFMADPEPYAQHIECAEDIKMVRVPARLLGRVHTHSSWGSH